MEGCANCGKTHTLDENGKGKALNRCAKCLQAKYCSQGCQRAAWRAGHKNVCKKAGDTDEATASKA